MKTKLERSPDQLAPRIANHPFFNGLDPRYLGVVRAGAEEQVFEAGAMITKAGDLAYSVYLIEEGRVVVEAHDHGDAFVQTLGPGDVLGWSWLFAPFRWHLQARAVERTRVIRLDGSHLLAQCEAHHRFGYEIMKRIARVVVARLQAARTQLAAQSATSATGNGGSYETVA